MSQDQLDHQIVDCLKRDGRMSNVEIGRQVGVSEATVRKRISRLIDDGLRVVAVDTDNDDRLECLLRIRTTGRPGTAQRLASRTTVDRVFITAGTFDLLIHGVFSSALEYRATLAALHDDPDIDRIEADVLLDVLTDPLPVVHPELEPLVDGLASATDLEILLDAAFDDAERRFGADRMAVFLQDDGVSLYAGSRGLSAQYLLDSSQAVFRANCGEGPVVQALRGGASLAVVDCGSHPSMEGMREALDAEGFKSVWVLLMRSGSEVLGTFNLYFDHRTEPDARFEAAQQFADAVGAAVRESGVASMSAVVSQEGH